MVLLPVSFQFEPPYSFWKPVAHDPAVWLHFYCTFTVLLGLGLKYLPLK